MEVFVQVHCKRNDCSKDNESPTKFLVAGGSPRHVAQTKHQRDCHRVFAATAEPDPATSNYQSSRFRKCIPHTNKIVALVILSKNSPSVRQQSHRLDLLLTYWHHRIRSCPIEL